MVSSQRDHTDYWFGRLSRGAEAERQLDRSQGLLYYLSTDGLEFCPAFQYPGGHLQTQGVGSFLWLWLQLFGRKGRGQQAFFKGLSHGFHGINGFVC